MPKKEKPVSRHEIKYLCSATQIAFIQSYLHRFMDLDKHAIEKGLYSVRSLYFDDEKDASFHDNIDGISCRKKYRIRMYDEKQDSLYLEIKSKEREKTGKITCAIEKDTYMCYVEGLPVNIRGKCPSPIAQMNKMMQTHFFLPKVIVEYERIPYVYRNGNVRVTIDQNIVCSSAIRCFRKKRISRLPLLPTGQHILEIKFDEYIPDHISRILQTSSVQRVSFSKYTRSRLMIAGGCLK